MKNKIILTTAATSTFFGDRVDRRAQPAEDQQYRVSFVDPVELLRLMTSERMEIVMLLLGSAPLTTEEIAARTGRGGDVLVDDLTRLVAADVLERNANHQYSFDYSSIRVTAEWPIATAESNENLATESRSPVNGQNADEPRPESRAPNQNPSVEYARRIIHILMGVVVVLIVIDVIIFLAER